MCVFLFKALHSKDACCCLLLHRQHTFLIEFVCCFCVFIMAVETESDIILREHAVDVANTVCCNMTKKEERDLHDRLLGRLKRLERADPKLASLIQRGFASK